MSTPHQSFRAAQQSPQKSSGQPNGHAAYGAHPSYTTSFDGSQQSLSQPAPTTYSQSFPNGPVSNPGYARSFGEGAMSAMRQYNEKPQIYTAVYSNVSVYEMEISGVAVMRRRSDGWLNATQILKVAGVDKGKRTKVLEKEILTGEHEKVQGGYGKYQGTWISYRRGREFCRQYGVEDILRPLLDYDVAADGSQGHGAQETPTKEQAMAAQRKKFYANSSLDQRPNGPPGANGTFFSNISPTTSVALAAMNKAARLNSPAPRTSSTPRPSNMRQSQREPSNSQQSAASEIDHKLDSGYNAQSNGEPPRKRMRPDSQSQDMGPPDLPYDTSIRSATPTEPNMSFYEHKLMQESVNAHGDPIALPPLPSPTTDHEQEKMNLILDLFAEQGRMDYASHPALQQLSNDDLNMPLDAAANNALHWAATLAKVPLLKLLIQKGASIWRGNAAGQSPLISAVLVNNSWEHSCFPELLELLGPLIEVRDLQGRTILHHIAVSSGIKGRGPSSKYYLEALLEFLVRIGTKSDAAGGAQGSASVAAVAAAQADQQASAETSSQDTERPADALRGPISLVRFLSQIVNAQDKAGNTALNLVARIGNRSIIQQLLEIHADPTLPNRKGVSAKDFGVGLEPGEQPRFASGAGLASSQLGPAPYPSVATAAADGEAAGGTQSSQAEDLGQEVIASMTSMLTQNLASHKELLRSKTEAIDRLNEQIRELSAMQKSDLEKLQEMKERVKLRSERQAKIANLQREIEKKKASNKKMQSRRKSQSPTSQIDLEPDWLTDLNDNLNSTRMDAHQRQLITSSLPAPHLIKARLNAYNKSNSKLQAHADQLRARSTELEGLYRKVVALCTGVPEEKLDEALPALVAAVESERGGLGESDVGRVREFLRKTDGAREVDQDDEPSLIINPTITAAAERAHQDRLTAQAAMRAAAAGAPGR
ncbi:Putative transcription regulator HTH, APSES-type DNA-binding domain-containing protein [Septoria linicola]|uniref:Transcription regulator HTH, APSES-type DNA-binding domain-containing protein n=1 Tax=Septoria linicola TaxID=215465 RepID=A0A9Q9EJG3_9PEZI|nr:putative transcription regulator HTH, APSES-type DNA-binding domain-containing protein [Septoria linicola]USW52995.1 Putative transcription regulator HTH, APSES-type DNA-binding domain-containing protein [Septoria linicola]